MTTTVNIGIYRFLFPDDSAPLGAKYHNNIFPSAAGGGPALLAPAGGGTRLSHLRRTIEASSAAINSNAGPYIAFDEGAVFRAVTGNPDSDGFKSRTWFGVEGARSDMRMFFGFYGSTGAFPASADPSASINTIGLAKDQADTNLQIMHNDGAGSATKVDTGIPVTALLDGTTPRLCELIIECLPGGSEITVTFRILDTGAEFETTVSTNLPAADVKLYPHLVSGTGGATSTAVKTLIAKHEHVAFVTTEEVESGGGTNLGGFAI